MTPEQIKQDLRDAYTRYQRAFQQLQCTSVSALDAVISSGKTSDMLALLSREPPAPITISPEVAKAETLDLIGSGSLSVLVGLLDDLPSPASHDPEMWSASLERRRRLLADLAAEGEELSPDLLSKLTELRDDLAEMIAPAPDLGDVERMIDQVREGDEMLIATFGALLMRRIVDRLVQIAITEIGKISPRISDRLRAAQPATDRMLDHLRASHEAFDRLLREVRADIGAAA